MAFWAYLLRCADGSFYTGHTDDVEKRVWEHQNGIMPGYTSTRRPVHLIWCAEFASRDEAKQTEMTVKNWSRAKKLALIAQDWTALKHAAMPPSERAHRSSGSGRGPSSSLGETE